jgi:fructosamine-3-kinase
VGLGNICRSPTAEGIMAKLIDDAGLGDRDRVFAAYRDAFALADGWAEREPLHQLYPLLVHVNLFAGRGYERGVLDILDQFR